MIGGRFNIFRAYTGYLKTRSNQKEVTHASWVNRRNVELLFLQANEFDAKDSLILEPKISYYPEIKVVFGCGPTVEEKREKISSRNRSGY